MEDTKTVDPGSAGTACYAESRLEAQTEYSIALCRAIEHHCRGLEVPAAIADQCPHHARMLNERLPKVLGWQDTLQRIASEYPAVAKPCGCQDGCACSTCEIAFLLHEFSEA